VASGVKQQGRHPVCESGAQRRVAADQSNEMQDLAEEACVQLNL
jgi:hypothetical protein